MKRLLAAVSAALALGACTDQYGSNKSLSPIPPKTMALMAEKGMAKSDPILVRVYKKEAELEVWKKANGHYALLKSFPICRWSGQLGPKVREGDRQAPEGFYNITPALMNPNSSYYLSFDTGFPNAYDRAHNRSGSYLMVHGTCSSRGCYAMTDEGISEVYAIAREAFAGGQKGFQFQAYPFRMTADNLARYRHDPNMPFWKNLKEGSDHFEVTGREPKVSVCKGRYAFDTVGNECSPDPTLAPAIAEREETDNRAVAELVAKGTPAVRLVYADGGQNETFRTGSATPAGDSGSAFAILDSRPRRNLGDVSRPEALAEGPREIAMDTPAAKPAAARPTTRLAAMARTGREAAAEPAETPARTASLPAAPRTVLASADPDAPIPTPAAAEPSSRPLYQRMIGNVLGESEPPAAVAPPAPAAAAPPLPPAHRPTAASRAASTNAARGSGGAKHDGKSEARRDGKDDAKSSTRHDAARKPDSPKKVSEAGRLVPTSQSVGPSTAAFRTN